MMMMMQVFVRRLATKASMGNIKELRKVTQLPMKLCKQALDESSDDVDNAIEWLKNNEEARAQLAKSKLSSRHVGEGRISLFSTPSSVGMVQVNCETDFVARNDTFVNLTDSLAKACANLFSTKTPTTTSFTQMDADATGQIETEDKSTAASVTASIMTSIGENVKLTRSCGIAFNPAECVIGSYVHNNGAFASLVCLKSDNMESADKIQQLADIIAKNIVAIEPNLKEHNDDPIAAVMKLDLVFEPSKNVEKKIMGVKYQTGANITVESWVRWAKTEI
eukprot:m.6250 g.6250  ORF g.6250 m.6250 type:complete len:279 (-) comp2566_c0_seq1:2843-3679(-)